MKPGEKWKRIAQFYKKYCLSSNGSFLRAISGSFVMAYSLRERMLSGLLSSFLTR